MDMDSNNLITVVLIGGLAGWMAAHLTRGHCFGFLGNTGVGIAGAVVGGFLFTQMGLDMKGFFGSLVTSTAGAIMLIFAVSLFKKA